MTSHYDVGNNTLHIVFPVVPDKIMVTMPDRRGRSVYSARAYEFVRSDLTEKLLDDKEYWLRCAHDVGIGVEL